jgi:signal transduction histidine kinase
LNSAVRWYAEGFQKRSSIHVSVVTAPGWAACPRKWKRRSFRVVQESLTNVHRYSGSPDAEIRISAADGQVRLEVLDHGKGIASVPRAAVDGVAALGVGIPGMRERLRQLGGQLEVDFWPKRQRASPPRFPSRRRSPNQGSKPSQTSRLWRSKPLSPIPMRTRAAGAQAYLDR